MHGAPAVTYPTGRTTLLAALLLGVWLAGAAGAVWVVAGAANPPMAAWKTALLIGTCLLAGAALLWFWLGQAPRTLAWDGAQWRVGRADALPADAPALDVQVRLDLQRALLLRTKGGASGRSLWLWVQEQSDSARWHLLRCALHAAGAAQPAPDGREEGARA